MSFLDKPVSGPDLSGQEKPESRQVKSRFSIEKSYDLGFSCSSLEIAAVVVTARLLHVSILSFGAILIYSVVVGQRGGGGGLI